MYENLIPKIHGEFNRFKIKSHMLPNAIGMWPNEQQCFLWMLLNSNPEHNWMEIGSFCGGSASLMCLARREMDNRPNSVYSVDCNFNKYMALSGTQSYAGHDAMAMFDYNVYGQGGFIDLCNKVECYSDDIPENYNDGKVGFLFIDGFHSFKQVVNDFRTVLPYMSDDAIVAFHDVSPDIEHTSKENIEYDDFFNSDTEDFFLDEAINYILKEHTDFRFLDIPVKQDIKHYKETGLTSWVRGKTSPFNAVAAIRRHNEG
tara:strand:+ start:551 stop:1327 length:777 start_codon:yes stop_codon:yes gene_type:complete